MNKKIRTALALAILACASLALTAPARAQAVYGSIFGTVTDKSGAAVPNATVTVTDEAKGTTVTVTSNASGDYSVPHLIPDSYTLKVSAKGFKGFEAKGITVNADTAPRIDPTLDVGGATETVQVNADQQPELKTDRADVSTVFDSQQVASLPVGDQNFTNLQLLVPGAQKLGWSHAASENPQASQQIMVNGQAFAGTAFELDGTDNQDPILGIIVINPTMDAVTETKITTQNFDAEMGKAVSAVVTAQTRSGTNSLHGTAYDFRTSNANLARDPFQQAPNSIPGGLKNRYGGTIGGPITIPHLYSGKDRAFFFFNYEGQRQRLGTSANSTLPTNLLTETALGKQVGPSGVAGADFSEYVNNLGAKAQIYDTTQPYQWTDPKTGNTVTRYQPFANNVIPTSQLNPQALNFLKLLEPYTKGIAATPGNSANSYNLDNNWKGSGTGTLNSDQWTERVDYTLSEKMHAFERFSRFSDTLKGNVAFGEAGGPGFGIGGYGGTSKGANDSLASGMDIAISPTLLTDFRLGYYRYNIITSKHDQSIQEAAKLGIQGLNTSNPVTGGSPAFLLDNVPTGGTGPQYGDALGIQRCNCPLKEKEDQGQIVNNWTMIHGNHTIKVGADLRYARNLRVPSDKNRTGELSFSGNPTSDPANPQATGGLSFATFMLGDVTSLARYVSTSTNAKEFQKRTFFYGQDTWRATHKLTLNAGLRWELYFPEKVNGDRNGALLNINDGYLHVAGVGGQDRAMGSKIDKTQMFAPRLGITYQFDPKTVIRAGYGRSFDIGVFGSIFGHVVTQNLPVVANQQANATTTVGYAFNMANAAPAPAANPVPSNGLLPNPGDQVNSRARPATLRFPTIDAWNMAVQRSLTPTLSLTVAYVGNKGTHNLGDGSGNTTNPNEAAIFLPGKYSPNGQTLHYDPNGAGDNTSLGSGTAVQNQTMLRRFYNGSLPACRDSNYTARTGVASGACGWTSDITYYSDDINTNFNAMQVTLTQNTWKGLNYTLNYQWAQAFSESTGFFTWSHAAGRGRDSNVRTQQATFYGSYALPFGKGKQYLAGANRLVDALVGGYELSTSMNLANGLPFELSYSEANKNVPGSAPSRPSYASGAHMKTSLTGYKPDGNGRGTRQFYTKQVDNLISPGSVNTGVFKNPGLDTIGNVGRNSMRGPAYFNDDMAISKSFQIWESVVTKFRMDAFNAFNHINPGNPGGNIESDGSIGGMANGSTARQLEFSLRLQF